MPKGGKTDREMNHIKDSEMARGKSAKEAESIAWAHIKHPPTKHKKSRPEDVIKAIRSM